MATFKLSLTLSGQTTTIEVDNDSEFLTELGEVMIGVEQLLLGAGFQPDSIKQFLNLDI
jgi:hypothetical protein